LESSSKQRRLLLDRDTRGLECSRPQGQGYSRPGRADSRSCASSFVGRRLQRRQRDEEVLVARAIAEAALGVHVESPLAPVLGRAVQVDPETRLAGRAGRSLRALWAMRPLRSLGSLRPARSRGTGLAPRPRLARRAWCPWLTAGEAEGER